MFKYVSFLLVIFSFLSAKEYRVGYVDMNRVISQYKDLADARANLQTFISGWRSTADSIKRKIDSLDTSLNTQIPMLSDEEILNRRKQIKELRAEYSAFVSSIWGDNGKLQKKTEEIYAPYMEKIHNAVSKIAKEQGVNLMLDNSSKLVVYTDKENDYTDMILEELNKEYVKPVVSTVKKKIGVFPFKETDNMTIKEQIGSKLQNAFTNGLKNSPNFETSPSDAINKQIPQLGFSPTNISAIQAKQVAMTVGIEYYITGTCKKQGTKIIIQAFLYESASGKKLGDVQGQCEDTDNDIQVAGVNLARQLTSVLVKQ